MKKEFKGFIAGTAVTALIFSVSMGIFGNKRESVELKKTSLSLNETKSEEEILLYNGEAYLSVPALGEIFNKAVVYDASAGMVHIGEKEAAAEEAGHKAAWSYSGASGPEYWGDLNEEYSLAKTGMQQSPINLEKETSKLEQSSSGLELHYTECEFAVENNGHTIEAVPSDQDNYITLDGVDYYLAQFHFHAPSEHQIDGVNAEMEVHFVHKSKDGEIAVIGVLIGEGSENQELKELLDTMPAQVTEEEDMVKLDEKIDILKLLPKDSSMFRYDGSLTTPPCTEGVKWIVYQSPILFSQEQLNAYKAIYSGTNRLVQPLNEREVTLYQ